MKALRQVPCAYHYNVEMCSRSRDGYWYGTTPFTRTPLEKRMHWIGQCSKITYGELHHFDYYRQNRSTYFFETLGIEIPKRYSWGWGKASLSLQKGVCYYIGTFPNYWDTQYKTLVYPHKMDPSRAYSIGNRADIPGLMFSEEERETLDSLEETYGRNNMLKYLYPERYPASEISEWNSAKDLSDPERPDSIPKKINEDLSHVVFFHAEFDVKNYLAMKIELGDRKSEFDLCSKMNYPKPEKPIKPKAWTPQDIKDVVLPTPTTLPTTGPPGATQIFRTLRFRLSYGTKPITQTNTLELEISLE